METLILPDIEYFCLLLWGGGWAVQLPLSHPCTKESLRGLVESLFQFLPSECYRPRLTVPLCPEGSVFWYHLSFCGINNNINSNDDDFIILGSARFQFGNLGPCGVSMLSLCLSMLPLGMIVCV